jgi:hypothetical protein
VELDSPGSVEALYLERGEPIEPWRPVMTGDVFDGPVIPGCGPHELILVLSHPCSLRSDGVQLVERVQALPVSEGNAIPVPGWRGNFRVMPLPELRSDERHYRARLTEFGMVPAEELDLDRRLCALTEEGVMLLQQRFFHNQSRVKVELPTIYEEEAPLFTEIELWTQWNEELVEPRVAEGAERETLLDEEGYSFDQVMGSEYGGGKDLRGALKEEHLRAEVRRRVLAAIDERAATAGA